MRNTLRRELSPGNIGIPDCDTDASESSDSPREHIHKISARLFAIHGYEAVGVPELCSATGLGRGAFYYHANSKDSILFEISKGYMEGLTRDARLVADEEQDPVTTIERLSEAFVRSMFTDRAEMTVCFRELHLLSAANQKNLRKLYLAYQAIWEEVVNRGVAEGVFRPLHSIELRAILGMHFYSFLWMDAGKSARPETVTRYFSRLVLDAIRQIDTERPRARLSA